MCATTSTVTPSDAHAPSRRAQRGFTLIELMIVVAIIGILAAMAIPAYQDFTIRAQVTEGLSLASDLKAGVAEYVANNGIWPADETALGEVPGARTGKYVTGITVNSGTIQITFGGQANNSIMTETLALQPGLNNNDDVQWVCGRQAPPAVFIADVGGTTSADAAAATSPGMMDRYLPTACHA